MPGQWQCQDSGGYRGPKGYVHGSFLFLIFLFLIPNFLAFVTFIPVIYMVSTFLEGLISYLSLETRVQLVKVSVEREM